MLSYIVAVTVTVPVPVVFKTFPLMDAPVVPASLTLHDIALMVASDGDTVPMSVSGVPAIAVFGTPDMPVTETNGPLAKGPLSSFPSSTALIDTADNMNIAANTVTTNFCLVFMAAYPEDGLFSV